MSSPFFNQRYVDGHVVSASIHPREGHDRIDYEDVEVLSERDANGRPRYWMQMVMEGGKVGYLIYQDGKLTCRLVNFPTPTEGRCRGVSCIDSSWRWTDAEVASRPHEPGIP